MLEELLNSKTRVKVLRLFFQQEADERYGQEVILATKGDAANVHRELQKLTKLGVLVLRTEGKRKLYRLNHASPFFRGLRELVVAAGPKAALFQHLNEDTPWILGEDIPDMDLFFSQIWVSGFVNEFERNVGKMYKKVLAVHEGYHLWFYYGERDSNDVGEHIVRRILDKPEYAVRVNREIVKASDRLRRFAETLPESGLEKLTSQQLWEFWKTHDEIHTDYYAWGWIPVAADMFHNNLTNAVIDELRRRGVASDQVNQDFAVLTQPTAISLIQKEQQEFLQLAAAIQADPYHKKLFKNLYAVFEEQDASAQGLAPHTPAYEQSLEQRAREIRHLIRPKFLKLIEAYFEKYFFMKHMWIGKDGLYTFEHYLKELVKLVGRNSDAKSLLHEQQADFLESRRKRETLLRKLRIVGKWRTIFDAFGDFMVTKIYRRYAQIFAIYRMQPLQDEVARRLKLSKAQVRSMLVREVGEALLHGKIDRADLEERTKFAVHYVEKGHETVFTGAEARRLADRVKPKDVGAVEEIKGQVGCVGKAQGIVRIIIRPSDMAKMHQGDVLVSIATDPDIVPAMKKAAAIVTEQGGVTSHAAIVSRELNIPCVIGTKIATKALKDGDLVDVDAVTGVVKLLKRAN